MSGSLGRRSSMASKFSGVRYVCGVAECVIQVSQLLRGA